MRPIVLALSLSLLAVPAQAGETPWQEVAPGVKVRLITSDKLDDGVTLAGLELDMPESTNTYWRIPGETGIPTELDFAASTGVSDPWIHWPYPEIDRSRGYLDYVYFGPTVLPFEISADEARDILREAPGVMVVDKREDGGYVTPVEAVGEYATYVSRIREDSTVENGLSLWVVSDNLRKGAALNAVQIAELLGRKHLQKAA